MKNMKKKVKIKKKYFFLDFSKKLFLFFLYFLMIVFLAINIFSSQNISPLFLKVINSNYQATVLFLKKIKKTPYFFQQLTKFKKIYGEKIASDVFFDDIQREKKIKKFKDLLKLNPDSRDLLYNLYLLYKQAGNEKLAQEYLKKARKIDPWIK